MCTVTLEGSGAMKELAVYMLLQLGGKPEPTKEEVAEAMGAAGLEVDEEQMKYVMTMVIGKDIEELKAMGADALLSSIVVPGLIACGATCSRMRSLACTW